MAEKGKELVIRGLRTIAMEIEIALKDIRFIVLSEKAHKTDIEIKKLIDNLDDYFTEV